MCVKLHQLCLTFFNPVNCSPPGSSVSGILQARILYWIAMHSSRRSLQSRDQTSIFYLSCIGRRVLYHQHHLGGEGNGTRLQYSCLENPMEGGAWQAAVHGVARSQTQLSNFLFTFHFHALEKEMATHSSVLAWRIPGTGEPGGCRLWDHTESDTTEVTQQQQHHHLGSPIKYTSMKII